MCERVHTRAALMDQVMGGLGINPASAARLDQGSAFYIARSRCVCCVWALRCADWLKQRPDGEISPFYGCPNRPFFERCQTDRAELCSKPNKRSS